MSGFVYFWWPMLAVVARGILSSGVVALDTFALGKLRVRTNWTSTEIYEVIHDCFASDPEGDMKARSAYRHFTAAIGKSLPDCAKWARSDDDIIFNISHTLNSCSSSLYIQSDNPNKALLVAKEEARKEVTLNAALAVMPWNHMAVKNLAYEFEWLAYVNSSVPLSLMNDCKQIMGFVDPGLELQSVFISPTLLRDQFEAFYHHIHILSRAYHTINDIRGNADDDPSMKVRELQLNIQYLGISPGVLSIAFGAVVNHLFPGISTSLLSTEESQTMSKSDKYYLDYEHKYDAVNAADLSHWRFLTQDPPPRSQIRLGIVSEHEDNSSPGNCLKRIFMHLAGFTHVDTESKEVRRDFEFIFFAREGSRTVFTAVVSNLSERSYTLDHSQGALGINRALIASERLDVLLYIALPTEKLSWFLSQARLAPVQVVFGVGHPLTSGSINIDYSIVSESMFQSLDVLTQKPPSLSHCMELSQECAQELTSSMGDRGRACDAVRRSGCAATPFDSRPPTFYSEQLVVMDSLSYFLEEHLDIYDQPVRPLGLSYEASCEQVNERLMKWGFYPNVTAEQLGCIVGVNKSGNSQRTTPSVKLYSCIQIQKKMHPSFDPVIAGVLRSDPRAMIMVEAKFKTFFPRLLAKANSEYSATPFSLEELHTRILLVPRLPHFDYQQLISMSSVFLNTFPFGAGITSSEAIATCVPVVVDAARSSVLHLGLAQVRRLGGDFAADLIVHGEVEDYVHRAVTIANLDTHGRSTHVPLLATDENKHGRLYAYRNALCRRKKRLLGDETAAEVAREWGTFLKSVAEPYK